MTLATAKALLEGDSNFKKWYLLLGSKYINLDCFGKRFEKWIHDELAMEESENDSYGNGCLMRLSPIMYIKDRQKSQELTVDSCLPSHCNSQSIVACNDLFMLYQQARYRDINWLRAIKIDHIYPKFEKFEVSAFETMKFVKQVAYGTHKTQLAIEKVVKCGGDTDTNASIVGELQNFLFQDITKEDAKYIESKLDPYLLGILKEFNEKF